TDEVDALLGEIQTQVAQSEPAQKEAAAAIGDDIDALMSQMDQKPEAKQTPAADDIDALMGEIGAQTEQASKAKPAQAPKAPATDDLDALMSQLDQKPKAKQAPAADEVDALLGEIQTQVAQSEPAQKEAAAAMGDDIDALMSQMDQKPADTVSQAAPTTDDLDALMGQLDQKPEAKQAPAADDIDALMGGIEAQTAQASKAKPAQEPKAPTTDEVDALLGEMPVELAKPTPEAAPEVPAPAKDEQISMTNDLEAIMSQMDQQPEVTSAAEPNAGIETLLDQMQDAVEKSASSQQTVQNEALPEDVADEQASVATQAAEASAASVQTQPAEAFDAERAASSELVARVQELESRLADYAEQLETIQGSLTERMEICETTLSDVQLSLGGLRDELTSLLDPEKLLAKDSPLTQHIGQTISAALEQGMQKIVQEAETQKSLHQDVTSRLDDLNAKVQGLVDEQRSTPLEDIEKMLDEKTAHLAPGLSAEDLEKRLEPVRLASEKSSGDLAQLSQKIEAMANEFAQKSEKSLEQVMSKIEAYDFEGLEGKIAAMQREKEVLVARVDGLEKRIDTLEPTFNARIDKAAAGAAARILREELRVLLEQA
ncbi:MAG: hypothetical protein J5846_05655, partial [Desulfovibrio sp.]|nr:hypothetical protein [Desulfovibrio sp.]